MRTWLALSAAIACNATGVWAGADAAADLRACAAVDAAAERLACYDRLSGRGTPAGERTAAAAAPTVPPSATESPTAAPPATASPTARASPAAIPPPATATPAAGTFGLYAAEHPAPPPAAVSLTGRVKAVGTGGGGRQTVSLEDGGLWELETSDPLLAVGDVVTIRRAAMHSFILETPSRREHRAQRLQ